MDWTKEACLCFPFQFLNYKIDRNTNFAKLPSPKWLFLREQEKTFYTYIFLANLGQRGCMSVAHILKKRNCVTLNQIQFQPIVNDEKCRAICEHFTFFQFCYSFFFISDFPDPENNHHLSTQE